MAELGWQVLLLVHHGHELVYFLDLPGPLPLIEHEL